MTVFIDPLACIVENARSTEDRMTIIGRSLRLRTLLTVFVERGEEIRIISAREATRHERRHYEEGK
jgi:uncharacterized DUF497 family protein